ncbi:4505_t:CDS:2 [Cetraspora pellucida]|uniref:4505_t:CDS:1 n=1 Tax=Cetraspora pellucida TaxID=1433469 RepID=A0A9N8ZUM1_9GLOM|nr:4505_t:CDS:2 [Cetraspora pellucida]
MALRVPFYLSMLACKTHATITVAFTLFHRLAIAGISIITYLRVCKQKACNTGRYDWKLFLPVAIISVFLSIISFNTYGPVVYWCAAIPNTIAIPIFSIFMTVIVLSICSFCYIRTIQAIRSVKKQQSEIVESSGVIKKRVTLKAPIDSVEMKVSIKVMGYILVFMLQWVPAIPYDIYQFYGRAAPWVYCMVLISVNSGSVGNAIFYVINEGWSRYGSELSSSSQGQFNDTSKNSAATLNQSNTYVKSIDVENGTSDIKEIDFYNH